jgi:hypothetical protein
MLLGLALISCLISVPLVGGRLTAVADLRFRHPLLAVAGIALQVLIINVVPNGAAGVHDVVHLASYALVGAFVVANLRIAGVGLLGAGGLANLAAIVANHGVMPAKPAALVKAGLPVTRSEFINSTAVAHPKLALLGDVFATPAWFPIHNVYSVGDVLIALGALVVLHRASGSRLGRLLPSRRPAVAVSRVQVVRASPHSVLVRVAGRWGVPPGARVVPELLVADGSPASPVVDPAPVGGGVFRAAFAVSRPSGSPSLTRLRMRLPGGAELDLDARGG